MLNLNEVELTDTQLLKSLKQARTATRDYWTGMKNQEEYHKTTGTLKTLIKRWTEDVCETSKNLTQEQT